VGNWESNLSPYDDDDNIVAFSWQHNSDKNSLVFYVCISVQNAGVVVMTDGFLHEAEHMRKNATHFLI